MAHCWERRDTSLKAPPLLVDEMSAALGSGLCCGVVLSTWGNQHFRDGTFKNPRPLDFVLPTEPGLDLDPQAEIISYDVMTSSLRNSLARGLELINVIRQIEEKPTFVLSAPPPIGPLEDIPEERLNPVDREASRKYGFAPPHLRYKCWKACELLTRELAETYGATFVPVPEASVDRAGFRRPEYWGNDFIHGNTAYGELVLQQIERIVASSTEPS